MFLLKIPPPSLKINLKIFLKKEKEVKTLEILKTNVPQEGNA